MAMEPDFRACSKAGPGAPFITNRVELFFFAWFRCTGTLLGGLQYLLQRPENERHGTERISDS